MRIKKMPASANEDDDDVQIVYEGPIDEDCQILEVVNPPLVDPISSALPNASGSRISVISRRKHPATDTLQSPSNKTSVIKRPALQGNINENETEQTIPFNLTQPSTSQMPNDYLENMDLSQQPSTSGEVSIDSLNTDSQASDGDINSYRINSLIVKKVRPIRILLPSDESPHRIISDLKKSSSSDPLSPREMKMKKIIMAFHNREKIRRLRRTVLTASRSDPQTVPKSNDNNPSIEDHISQETQSVSLTSQSSTSPIQEISEVANNTHFPSAALISQQGTSEQNRPQQQVEPSSSEVIPPHYNTDHSYSSPAGMNRWGELEQPPPQATHQHTVDSIMQPNNRTDRRSPITEEVNNWVIDFMPSATLMNQQTALEPQQATQSNIATTPHDNCELLGDYSFLTHFAKFILQVNTSCMQQAMTTIQQPANIPSEAPVNLQQDHCEQQVAGTATQTDIITTPYRQRIVIPYLPNQVIQLTLPSRSDQESNSHEQVSISQQGISSIGLNNSTMAYLDALNEQKHAIWNGTVECYENINGSSVKLGLPFNCTISMVATAVRKIESASFWPCQLVLQLHPVDLSIRMNVLKEAKRVVMLDFHQESEFKSILQGTITGSGYWIGLIELPATSPEEKIIVIYVPLKKIYLGFIANADSSCIQRIAQTCREFNSDNQHKNQASVRMFETLGLNTDPCTSILPSPQRFEPSVSHMSPRLSIQQASIIPSSATSLLQPVHLQSNLPQSLYQPTSLLQPLYQPTSLPQPVLPQTSLPQPVLPQTSLSQQVHPQTILPHPVHPQTSLPPPAHLQTSLPQPAHLQTSLPQPAHPQTSFPQPEHLQTSLHQPAYPQTSLHQPTHPQTSLPQAAHLQATLHQPVHLQTSLSQPVNSQTSLSQPIHLQTSLPRPLHLQTSLPQPVHPQTNLPQPVPQTTCMSEHICMPPVRLTQQAMLHRCLHHTSSISACPYRQTNFPGTSQQKAISYHVGGSLEVPLQTRFRRDLFTRLETVNKYETVDRHIDAYISALRQHANTSVQGAGPSTSQTPTELQQTRLQIHIEETIPGTGTNNEQMQLSDGGESSRSNEASYDQDPILMESQASEIFSKSVVKKVVRKILKETGKQFKSADELCEAILEYEERKQKHKVEKKLKPEVNEALLCKICMDQQMNIVFEPCGHLATCETCAQPLNKCPMCRSVIMKNRKIYMS